MVTSASLTTSGLFQGLSPQHLEAFATLADEVTVNAGKTIFGEGDPADKLYILLDGKVNIHTQLTSRPEQLSIAVLNKPGQLVGWSGLLPEDRYTAGATCETDSRLVVFDGDAFMALLESDAELGFLLMRRITDVISSRLRNIQQFVLKTL